MRTCLHFIGNVFSLPAEGEFLDVTSPIDNSVIARIAQGTRADVDRAVAAARDAYDRGPWGRSTPAQRGAFLRRVAAIIRERRDEIAEWETRDAGIPIRDTRGLFIPFAADCFDYYAGIADALTGEVVSTPNADVVDLIVREPYGVVAQILPWNLPFNLAAYRLAPTLAAGNTVVLKSPELAPVTCGILAEVFQQADLPPGVVNVIHGTGPSAGAPLAGHPDIDKVGFTGSIPTGTRVMQAAAENITPVTLELGGKSPQIVFADADLDRALAGVLFGAYFVSGQNCVAGTRLLVHESIYDRFRDRVVNATERMRMGDLFDERTQIGPIISRAQLDKIHGYIDSARNEGAIVRCGGESPEGPAFAKGNFIRPTVLDGVRPTMRVATEEIFGPVLSMIGFRDDDEAVEIANGTRYGLGAGVWTNDLARAHRLGRQIDAGSVWINTYCMIFLQGIFGGHKQSGIGVEFGLNGVREYTQLKTICIDVGTSKIDWAGDAVDASATKER
jgi:betaine-aldehyde dehydrogenase